MSAPPLTTDATPLRVDLRVGPDAVWIHVSGEVDLAGTPRLHAAIDTAFDNDLPVWLNLSGITFLDSACVHEVIHAQRNAFARGTCLLIVPPASPHLLKPFDLMHLTDRLPFVEAPAAPPKGGHLRGLPSLPPSESRQDGRHADVSVEG